jgi:Lon protease-like protein
MSIYSLPLFPLNTVIYPQGLLSLKIFETPYLDMIRSCIRNATTFGVITAYTDNPSIKDFNLSFAKIGTSIRILDAVEIQPNIIMIRCAGYQRFNVKKIEQLIGGLFIAKVEDIPNDLVLDIPEDLKRATIDLQNILHSTKENFPCYRNPFILPYKFNDCGWVANRLCELLDLSLIEKQRMLELGSPLIRLELVHDKLLSDIPKSF